MGGRTLVPQHLAAGLLAVIAIFPFPLHEAVLLAATGCCLVTALQARWAVGDLRVSWAVLLLGLWIPLTLFWSVDPATTLTAVVKTLALLTVGVLITGGRDIRQVMVCVAEAATFVLLLSWAAAVLVPHIGLTPDLHEQGSLRGVFVHRNYLAFFSVLALLTYAMLALDGRRGRPYYLAGAALAAASIIAAASRTSWLVLAVVLLLAGVTWLARRATSSVATLMLIIGGAATALGWLVLRFFVPVVGAIGRDTTLTGRTDIWESVVEAIGHRPLTGYGWNALYQQGTAVTEAMWAGAGFRFYHAHNGYLQIALEGGYVALALALLLVLTAAYRSLQIYASQRGAAALWPLLLVTTLAIYNTTETVAFTGLGLVLLVMLSCLGPPGAHRSASPSSRRQDRACAVPERVKS